MKVHAHLVVWRFYFIPYFVGDTELAEGWLLNGKPLDSDGRHRSNSFFRLKANMLHYCSPQQHSVSAFSCAPWTLGLYADHKGRRSALLLIIILMTAAIAMIGFAPTYAAVGLAAPLIIVLARLLQGLATGGEFAGATSFLIESAPQIGAVFTAPGRWPARVWLCLSAHFWGRSLHGT